MHLQHSGGFQLVIDKGVELPVQFILFDRFPIGLYKRGGLPVGYREKGFPVGYVKEADSRSGYIV